MVQVRVSGVAVDAAGAHVLLLKPLDALPGEGKVLPVWIGPLEATAILIAVQGVAVPRPLTHDLTRSLLDAAGAEVSRVHVARIEEGTFYAEIVLATQQGERTVDARPSDAVALAARAGASISVADEVLEEAGMPDLLSDEEAARRLEEFKSFLENVDPEDFQQ